jgi:hypothetical protein
MTCKAEEHKGFLILWFFRCRGKIQIPNMRDAPICSTKRAKIN